MTRSMCGDGTRLVGMGEVSDAAKGSSLKLLDCLLEDAQ